MQYSDVSRDFGEISLVPKITCSSVTRSLPPLHVVGPSGAKVFEFNTSILLEKALNALNNTICLLFLKCVFVAKCWFLHVIFGNAEFLWSIFLSVIIH